LVFRPNDHFLSLLVSSQGLSLVDMDKRHLSIDRYLRHPCDLYSTILE